MKYRQWKKNYKKSHGVNPPLELDKRKQRRLAKKAVKAISRIDFVKIGAGILEEYKNAYTSIMRGMGKAFEAAATVCINIADCTLRIRSSSNNTQTFSCGLAAEKRDDT